MDSTSASLEVMHAVNMPRTPEPQVDAVNMPAAPRRRFQLKRRSVSQNLLAPTNTFLASVASADVPLPSIEATDANTEQSADVEVLDIDTTPHADEERRGRAFVVPSTPAPGSAPSLSPSRFPNWSIDSALGSGDSSPEPGSRPSTSRSSWTNPSLWSGLSSYGGEDDEDEFDFSPKVQEQETFGGVAPECQSAVQVKQPEAANGRTRKSPWTPAMLKHLWAVYELYLSDPRVTPIRMGNGGIPPEGVQLRVARHAARSWKGAKAAIKSGLASRDRSGSSTPTAITARPFIKWPHTKESTKAQLRFLCKQKARGIDGARFRYMSRTPTPFTGGMGPYAVAPPTFGRQTVPFETRDMTASLFMSTADAMQSEGPLAQLTRSAQASVRGNGMRMEDSNTFKAEGLNVEPTQDERRRLGSPFSSRTFGPSSGKQLEPALPITATVNDRYLQTLPRQQQFGLGSPVQLSRPQTQKRKGDAISSYEARKKPSLGAWTTSARLFDALDTAQSHDAASSEQTPSSDPFAPRARSLTTSSSVPRSTLPLMELLEATPRLGSPFVPKNLSSSVPNRIHQMQTPPPVPGHLPSGGGKNSRGDLSSRLADLDRRLRAYNPEEPR